MPFLKSWREEFNQFDVDVFLTMHKMNELWECDGIAGDGDILLKYRMDYASVDLAELNKLNDLFKPKSLVIDADTKDYAHPVPIIRVTLSWNN